MQTSIDEVRLGDPSVLLQQHSQQIAPKAIQNRLVGIPPSDPLIIPRVTSFMHNRRQETFPTRLHQMLTQIENTNHNASAIVSFVDDGAAFIVRNAKGFETEIIPKFFPRMKYFTSFQRQLNLYDFERIDRGPHIGGYRHKLFHRDHPHMTWYMHRTKIKGRRPLKYP